MDGTGAGPRVDVIRNVHRLTRSALDNIARKGQPGDGGHITVRPGTRITGGVMRLGRKIAEGFAVDHEADRLAATQERPAPVPEPEVADWSPIEQEQPARSGSRED